MAMDDINGGGGGSYTPSWRQQQDEARWAAEKEEERRKERVEEQESYSYNPPAAAPTPAPAPAVAQIKAGVTAAAAKAGEDYSKQNNAENTNNNNGTVQIKAGVTAAAAKAGEDYSKQDRDRSDEGESGGSGGGTNYQTGRVYPGPSTVPTPTVQASPAEQRAEAAAPVYNPPAVTPVTTTTETTETTAATPKKGSTTGGQVEVVRPFNDTPNTEETGKSNLKARPVTGPVVYTGGNTLTGNTGTRQAAVTEAANRKTELTDEEEYILYQNFMALDAAAQREALRNPQVQQAIQNQGRRQAQRLRDEAMAASEARHTLGAGPTEPGTWQYTTATGPILPREGAVTVPGASGSGADYFSSNPAVRQYTPGTAEYEQAQAAAAARAFLDQQNEIMGMTRVSDMTPAEQMRHQPGYSYVGFVPTAEGQEDFDTQVRILKGRGYPEETAVAMAQEEFGNYSYSGDQPSYVRRDVPQTSVGTGAAMQSYLQEGRDQAAGQGLSGNDAENYAVTYANERMRVLEQAAQMTPQEAARRAGGPTSAYYYEPIPGTGSGSNYYAGPTEARRSGEERAEERSQQYAPTAGGQESTNSRPGADAALADVMNGSQRVPDSVRFAQERAARTNDYLNRDQASSVAQVRTPDERTNTATAGKSYGPSAGGESTKTQAASAAAKVKQVVDKALKLRPTYGQGGQVVKAPYRNGGYSEDELKAMGNNAYGKKNGNNVYEGYYEWNGKYYPVDQEKAAYYRANGNSYRGWQEPMREYYKNFGTYYGYRPDWKTAGGVNVWKQNRPSTRNYYSGGGSAAPSNEQRVRLSGGYGYSGGSGYGSYGRGSTANNGLYWNPNTSWSI